VLVHNPADAEWFDARILPDLARTTDTSGGPGALRLVATDAVPVGLAILDAPDVDSVEEQNRSLATQLLGAADLWLFVTSAARYADQVPWEYLRAAAERSTAVAVVLDRTPPEAVSEVSTHLARMLTARGLRDSPRFTVPEVPLDAAGLVGADLVAEIRSWLHLLASDSNARAAVVKQTLDGAVRNLARNAHTVADAAADQARVGRRLREDAALAYRDAAQQVMEKSTNGGLLRGEVLAHWQDLLGTGELLKSVESPIGHLRGRLAAALRGRSRPADRLADAVAAALGALVLEQAEAAAERVAATWRSAPAGRQLLETTGQGLGRASRRSRATVDAAVRGWQQATLQLVRAARPDARSAARYLAQGVDALGVALTVAVLAPPASTGEPASSAAGAVVGQKLLEAVFGEPQVRRMAAAARADLERRVAALFEAEQQRFDAVLDALPLRDDAAEQLRETARRVDDLRFASELGESEQAAKSALPSQPDGEDQDAEARR